MPRIKWDDLTKKTNVPGKSVGYGSTITGEMFTLQRTEYKEDRGDGKSGATLHSHPEEQMWIVLKGKLHMREEDEWYTVNPGEVFWLPPNTMHEAAWEGEGLVYCFKTIVPGHDRKTVSWKPGAKEDWEQHRANFLRLVEKYKDNSNKSE